MNAQPPDEEAIIHAARRIESPGARAAYLDQACGGDRVLRSRLDELLHALDHEPRFLESSPVPPGGAPGAVIGSYRPLRTIGEGGMGVVYLAEQEHPVRRRVALKVIKPGLDTAQVVARFEAERQALALMDHPNIARVLDAGAIADGRPYFVMELVRGIPITAYCDEHRLSVRERLELFIPVCQAIAHAHGAGVIHRDITPSNVLVTLVDDRPVPKVIDFGVAKAISQRLTEQIFLTQFGTIVGTLEYMSPEQAAAGSREPDVDPRSDVYSLGVLLYELLTGGTPLRRATLAQAPIDEILRRIREEVPPEPSRRVRQAAETRATIAARRRSEPAELIGQLRGPVDRIVMKALAKDRARRYDTARELARAIEHFLDPESREVGAPGATPRRASAAKNLAIAWAVTVGVLIGVAVLIPVLLAGGGRPARIGPAQESAPTARRPGPTNPEVAEAAPDTKTAEGDRGSARRPEAREGITPRPPSPGPPPTAPELDEDRRIAAIEAFGGHVSRNPYLTVDLSGAGPRLTDDALAHLSASLESLGSVHTLNLSRTGVTDAGLVHLKGLDRLAVLFLVGTRIHGPGLEHLQGLNRLRRLELGSTPVTDEF
ncbi:MAG TPA: serine/threonine-protein kinase, partial [Isosphaeraceae bacterium]